MHSSWFIYILYIYIYIPTSTTLSSSSTGLSMAGFFFTFLVNLMMLCMLTIGGSEAGKFNNRGVTDRPKMAMGEDGLQGHGKHEKGTTWAVLVAGSAGFRNYRHQADVCHAYQLLKKGGLKDEHIVVFMYDDIANNKLNPRPGVIINHPKGHDVYAGVPKDYTGENVTVDNLFAVLLGNRSAVRGGSGKVVHSKPNDRIFLYYTDHGSTGVLGMPNLPFVLAIDFIKVLKKKHASRSYKEMVIYIEACEAGSLFEGLLPEGLNIYVTTASNKKEDSYATYCPGDEISPPPPGYETCLGDLYSVAWLEDSDIKNRNIETLGQQYHTVRIRTSSNNTFVDGSHVTEYGDKGIRKEKLFKFQGSNNAPRQNLSMEELHHDTQMEGVNQRDADLLFLWHRYKNSEDGSEEKTEILKEISETTKHRVHLDSSMNLIGMFLFGPQKRHSILNSVRASGLPVVDDWQCLKSMVRLFETHCGSLTQYGMKHMRAFSNMCNNGVSLGSMEEASMAACSGHDMGQWNPLKLGFSA